MITFPFLIELIFLNLKIVFLWWRLGFLNFITNLWPNSSPNCITFSQCIQYIRYPKKKILIPPI